MIEAARAVGVASRAVTKVVESPGRRCKGLLWRSTAPAEQEGEEWREPPECDGKVFAFAYSVSNQGRIKGPKGLMHPVTADDGYASLHLVVRNEAGEHESESFASTFSSNVSLRPHSTARPLTHRVWRITSTVIRAITAPRTCAGPPRK